jgi:hypothetical protein
MQGHQSDVVLKEGRNAMTVHLNKNRLVILLAATLSANAAMAASPVGNAAAWDLDVHVNLIGVAQLDVGAQTSVQLTNVLASASDSQTLPSAAFASPLNLITLSTGALASDVEYVGSSQSANAARSSVHDLDLSAGASVLTLAAGTVTSTSALAGACPDPVSGINSLLDDFVFYSSFDAGNLGPGGGGGGGGGGEGGGFGGLPPNGGVLVDPQVAILGTPVPGLPLNPAPNTTIDLGALGIVGATLVLNEQTTSGDGVHFLASATNAIHLTLDVAQLVTADVIVAHSEVSLACP